MSGSAYNPEIHHRRSVRLKGHDYAGGGLYFVTICAHREFIAFARGKPFGGGGVGATQVSPVRGLIQKRMRITAEKCPFMKWEEAVIMPDHMHVLIRMQGGHQRLGDVIGGFKAAVSRELRRGNICVAPPKNIRIWHRNYHEMIVRTPDVEKRIGEYIRMNPWKLVTEGSHKGRRYRMIGNPSLLNCEKIGLLCSRNCPPGVLAAAEHRAKAAHAHHCFVSGFHSAPERAIQGALLHSQAKIICCPAWGIDALKIPADWLPALEGNRMLILEMRNREGNLAAAEQRNQFVIECADKLWLPHVSHGGMLDRFVKSTRAKR